MGLSWLEKNNGSATLPNGQQIDIAFYLISHYYLLR
jgi:hypothetical protein